MPLIQEMLPILDFHQHVRNSREQDGRSGCTDRPLRLGCSMAIGSETIATRPGLRDDHRRIVAVVVIDAHSEDENRIRECRALLIRETMDKLLGELARVGPSRPVFQPPHASRDLR